MLLVILALLLSGFSLTAQGDDLWTVTAAIPLDTLVRPGRWGYVSDYELSPDQQLLAWVDGYDTCVYSLGNKLTRCFRAPFEAWRLRWSPDTSAILLTSGDRRNATLQILDLNSKQFTLLEPAHYVSSDAFWDGVGWTVYFLSWGAWGMPTESPFLIAYSVRTHTYTRTDLNGLFPEPDARLRAVSPTGDRLIVASGYDGMSEGIWLIDAAARQSKQIASSGELVSALRKGRDDPADIAIMDVFWNQDSDTLWVTIGRGLPSNPIGVVSVDPQTFQRAAVIPARTYPDEPDDLIPYTNGRLTPDGALFLYQQQDDPKYWYTSSIYALSTEPPPGEPVQLVAEVYPDCVPQFVMLTLRYGPQVSTYLADYLQFCPG